MADINFFEHLFNPYSFEQDGETKSLSLQKKRDIEITSLVLGMFTFGIGGVIYFYAATDNAKRKLNPKINQKPPVTADAVDKVAQTSIGPRHFANKTFSFHRQKPRNLNDWLSLPLDICSQTFEISDWNDPSILMFGSFNNCDGASSETKNSLKRHGACPQKDYLSNFYLSPIKIDGNRYKSVEHFYQASKFEEGTAARQAVMQAASAEDARKAAQCNGNPMLENPEQIMKKALWAKFVKPNGSPTKLGEKLKLTRNWALIEGHKRKNSDRLWGMEFDFSNGHDAVSLTGENRLGKLLMELRSYLQGPF